MTFQEHKQITVEDCEAVIEYLQEIVEKIKEGNLKVFEEFWISGGTEEGDSKIEDFRERLWARYEYRERNLK